LEEGAKIIFFIKKPSWRQEEGEGEKSLTHPPSGSHPKNLEQDFWDSALVGAGSLKPEPTLQ
jgi:hypothetical protein